MAVIRPAYGAFLLLCLFLFLGCLAFLDLADRRTRQEDQLRLARQVVHDLALSDLALTTEARYTRHAAVSDALVVSMDHPGGLDHFPSTLFFAARR